MDILKSFTSALALTGAALLSGCNSDLAPVRAAGPTGVKNILLVHGAWSDGSGWSKVIPLLQGDGYNVVAVQLPFTSLGEDTAVVHRALALMSGHVLLVGHSYGGAVITQAGTDPTVEGLVYVAAYAPDQGESVLSLGASVAPTPIMKDFTQDATGFLKLTAAGMATDFAQDLTPVEQESMTATQGPTNAPNALGGVLNSAPAWRSVPSWYVIASDDRVIGPTLEQNMAARMKATVVPVTSSHVAMLAQPAAIVAVIEKAAGTLAP